MIFIVGGGVVGLHVGIALAERSNRPDIIICEQEQFLGDHCTGRNSQVIHAGFAYPVGSLKAELCVEGNKLSYEWLDRLGVAYERTGKWIVAFNDEELPALDKVLEVGAACNVPGLRRASADEVAAAEPSCHRFAGAVYSETSGMMDASAYIRALEQHFTSSPNCHLLYPCKVTGLNPESRTIMTDRGDMEYTTLINAAGLWADDIYRWSGGARNFQIKPFKGEYYVWKGGEVRSMIYPVPRRFLPGREHDAKLVSSMGVHLHRDTGGQLFVGPTQLELEFDQKRNYDLVTTREDFIKHAALYAPVDDPEDFEPAYAGNRPKVYEDGAPLGDFTFVREGAHVHLLGMDSPGLTAAPAIAQYVAQMVE